MESLQLPQDLYWEVKMEPNSPHGEFISMVNNEDSWIFEDSFAKDVLFPSTKTEIIDSIDVSNASSPFTDNELLYEFELDSKTEQWMDGKPNIHQQHQQHNIDYSENFIPPQSCPTQAIKVQNSLEIFMELEKIYDVPELTQLTPPHTPPQECDEVKEIFDLISAHQDTNALVVGQNCNDSNDVIDIIPIALSPSNSDYSSDVGGPQSPMPSDIAREMQIVDEILRSRAEELPDWTDNDDNNSHNNGNGGNDDDDDDDNVDDDDDDNESLHSSSSSSFSSTSSNEWGTLSLSSSSLSSSTNVSSASSSTSGKIPHEKSQKRRTRPYGRPLEDKKVRKKEQNKNAATRYRQKKKQEMEEILEEERQLAKHNENLTKQLTDIEREVKYLKQLIKEFHKNKKLQ